MPNHIAWASSGKRDIGERGVHSHPYLCQEWRLRETHAEMPHKHGLLEAYEISLTDVFGGQDSVRSHYDRLQEYKIN